MDFIIRRAEKSDYDGIIDIISKVFGPNDFIQLQISKWINESDLNYPLIAQEKESHEYASFNNIKIIGDYAWLEGLRVVPKFRRQKLALQMTEKSLIAPILKYVNRIGYATGNENFPMHKVANSLGFSNIGKQIVFFKKFSLDDKKDEESYINYNGIKDKNLFYALINKKYNSQIFTSFFKIPNNEKGKDLFSKIPVYESDVSYLLYEKDHGETTNQRGIFTVFLKNNLSINQLFQELTLLESSKFVKQYEAFSFAIPFVDIVDIDNQNILLTKSKEQNFQIHILKFFEKKLSDN